MKRIIDGVLKFQTEVFPNQKALFQKLSNGQRPQALFIGCSDSRVIPELFMQQGPGDLFVVRNAGNIVPPHGVAPGGVSASIEYAVAVLGVPDIVICGHSGCGAMTAILNGREQLKALPEVSRWLNFANAATQVIEEQHAHKNEADEAGYPGARKCSGAAGEFVDASRSGECCGVKGSAVAWMGVRYSYGDGDDLQMPRRESLFRLRTPHLPARNPDSDASFQSKAPRNNSNSGRPPGK